MCVGEGTGGCVCVGEGTGGCVRAERMSEAMGLVCGVCGVFGVCGGVWCVWEGAGWRVEGVRLPEGASVWERVPEGLCESRVLKKLVRVCMCLWESSRGCRCGEGVRGIVGERYREGVCVEVGCVRWGGWVLKSVWGCMYRV